MRIDIMTTKRRSLGFTLMEAIVVMVIVGIIAGMVAVFIRTPVESYVAAVRRARMSEEADNTLRFIARELHGALPNSIACTATTLSFRPIRSGGRYRESATGVGAGVPLQFGTAAGSFDTIGGGGDATLQDAHGVAIGSGTAAIGNLGSGVTACDANQAVPTNTPAVTALAAASVTFTGAPSVPSACNLQDAANPDPNSRTAGRFYMVGAAVTYTCAGGVLTRTASGVAGVMTSLVGACAFACDGRLATVQTISLRLTLTDTGDSMTLFRQVHVENYP